MPLQHDTHSFELIKSRIGQALVQIHANLARGRQQDANSEELFSNWQKKWSSRRDQITRRLELIESRLQELVDDEPVGPQLAAFTVPSRNDRIQFAETVSFVG